MLPAHVIHDLARFDPEVSVADFVRHTYTPDDASPELAALYTCAGQKVRVGELYDYATRGTTTRRILRFQRSYGDVCCGIIDE